MIEQPGALERFNREARVSATLDHPHIVKVIDFGSRQASSIEARLRGAERMAVDPTAWWDDLGFRCARTVELTPVALEAPATPEPAQEVAE